MLPRWVAESIRALNSEHKKSPGGDCLPAVRQSPPGGLFIPAVRPSLLHHQTFRLGFQVFVGFALQGHGDRLNFTALEFTR